MIGKLTGRIDDIAGDAAIIDVGGVGYNIFASARTLARLAQANAPVTLYIDTHVREDHIHLYGFLDAAERDWFRLLMTVQGVGARVSLAILGVLSPSEVATAIAAQDRAAIGRANGVGPKLAGRITAELKDKAGGIALGPAALKDAGTEGVAGNAAFADAVSALVNLGYRRSEAYTAIARVAGSLGTDAKADALIRAGLKELSAA
ncbi:MAG: Holliday junction branch migration protein RuvA [Rhodospirillaceae bacterium]|nr:Holliday junction branch migration protein RuvA [Rhodospirillaceae bacterium]